VQRRDISSMKPKESGFLTVGEARKYKKIDVAGTGQPKGPGISKEPFQIHGKTHCRKKMRRKVIATPPTPRIKLLEWLPENQEITRQKVLARIAFDDEFSLEDIENVSFNMGATTACTTTQTPVPHNKGRKHNLLEEKDVLISQALQQACEEEDGLQTTSSQEPQDNYISVVKF
jgi:DNA-binding cell septation regulator SpoVG